jgi:activator of 2-hydroxyglutaryl-CoA dehydratase
MLRRTGFKNRVVFAGGGAYNECLIKLLEEKLEINLSVPESPQTIGALGAALLARSGKLRGVTHAV